MIRIAVCEDVRAELQIQAEMIQSIMLKLSKNIKIFAFRSGEELLCEIEASGNMDVIFLDVEMLGISGLETARIIREKDTRAVLIFISCHNQYYREMIDVQPYAFLDKPVSEEKLSQILKQVSETRLELCDGYSFSYHKKQYNIPLVQIRLFQSDKRIIRVDTIHKNPLTQEYLFYGKLEEVEKSINEADIKFIRVRKSFLINAQYIIEYSADKVVLDNGLVVEISKRYKDNVTQQYMSALRGRRWE